MRTPIGARRRCRILVLREPRYSGHAQPAGLVAALRAADHDVHVLEPSNPRDTGGDQQQLSELMRSAEVVVARGRSAGVLSALRQAATGQVPVVDPAGAIAQVRDKIAMTAVLRRAGVPTPRTFVAPVPVLVNTVPLDAYPLILKPAFGDNARGLRLVEDSQRLRESEWLEEPALAQSFVPGDGVDLKLYVIGDHVTAVHKPSPFTPCTSTRNGTTVVDRGLHRLARLCGQLFGLTVYGVDCLETDSGPVVLEVNDFPNFTSVPDADRLLASHVLTQIRAVA